MPFVKVDILYIGGSPRATLATPLQEPAKVAEGRVPGEESANRLKGGGVSQVVRPAKRWVCDSKEVDRK